MNKAIILSFCILSLTACHPEQEKTTESVEVNVIQPESYLQNGMKSFGFISEPYRTTELSFRVGGPIQQLDIERGQFFRKGSLIACIDPRDYQTALQKAEAHVAQKRSEYKRIESLYRKNNVSASSYEQAQAELKTAEANYLEAQHNLRDTRMTAPTDGYIQQVLVERYADVAPTQPVLTFIDLSQIKMTISIPEQVALVLKNKANPSCRIVFSTHPADTLQADQVFVSHTTSATNISYTCTALLQNNERRFLGGMSGTLLFDLPGETSNTLSLPLDVVCNDPIKGSYVWTVDSAQCAQKTWITTGELGIGNRIEVVSGLHPHQQVISKNFNNLSTGRRVTVK